MKKFALALAIVATLVVALISTGIVSAQGPAPVAPQTPGNEYGYGRGGMNGRGGMGANVAAGDGILHDVMIAVYAEKLGIAVEDLNARLANGETISQIAADKGLTAEQFIALKSEARVQAVDQAVKDGTLTQAQADWLKQRGGSFGSANGRGAGRGMHSYAGDCPYFTQTNP